MDERAIGSIDPRERPNMGAQDLRVAGIIDAMDDEDVIRRLREIHAELGALLSRLEPPTRSPVSEPDHTRIAQWAGWASTTLTSAQVRALEAIASGRGLPHRASVGALRDRYRALDDASRLTPRGAALCQALGITHEKTAG